MINLKNKTNLYFQYNKKIILPLVKPNLLNNTYIQVYNGMCNFTKFFRTIFLFLLIKSIKETIDCISIFSFRTQVCDPLFWENHLKALVLIFLVNILIMFLFFFALPFVLYYFIAIKLIVSIILLLFIFNFLQSLVFKYLVYYKFGQFITSITESMDNVFDNISNPRDDRMHQRSIEYHNKLRVPISMTQRLNLKPKLSILGLNGGGVKFLITKIPFINKTLILFSNRASWPHRIIRTFIEMIIYAIYVVFLLNTIKILLSFYYTLNYKTFSSKSILSK